MAGLNDYSAFLYDRGGRRRIHQIQDISGITYNRVRDDTSTASINVSMPPDTAQASQIGELLTATGRYELVIFRGTERAWEGPITLSAFKRESMSIDARDVTHYLNRIALSKAYDNTGVNAGFATTRMKDIILNELGRKDAAEIAAGLPSVNVAPYLVEHHFSTDARTSRLNKKFQLETFGHIDDMAAKGGVDYVAVGRAIHLWDTSRPVFGETPKLTENDFLGEIYVSAYGMDLATVAIVTDGNGAYGYVGGVDPYYGLQEVVSNPYDENEGTTPTQAALDSQARRNLSGRNPTPIQVRVPDNSSLNMETGVLRFSHLVPGVYMPLAARLSGVKVTQMQKLQSVKVTVDSSGETITAVLYPASKPDAEVEE